MKLTKQYKFLTKYIKEYAGAFFNTTIVALTGGIELFTTTSVFRCPCVHIFKRATVCLNTTDAPAFCAQSLNFSYGISFIAAPAIGLLMLGMVSNPKLWKSCTGYMNKADKLKKECHEFCWVLLLIFIQAMISPISWIGISLLDGQYYACATTALPYDVGHASAHYKDCEEVAEKSNPVTSNAYNNNRRFSQVLGWVVIVVSISIGFLLYSISQCTSPLTYYHAKYYKFYSTYEEEEFEAEMKKKAQKDAESNVLKFMEKRRSKKLWDRISTVYEFHRDKHKLALYSYLHEWTLQENRTQERAPLLQLDDIDGLKVVKSSDVKLSSAVSSSRE